MISRTRRIFIACSAAFSILSFASATAHAAAPVATAAQPAHKANVAILATGGTIASRGANSMALTDYGSLAGQGHVGVQGLIDAVPEIQNYANISGEQVFNVGSSKLSIDNWLTLANRINALLASKDVDGVVVTHGTDTLEETAYFLNLVVKSDKPVVLVGSMRPATALSADGPLNLVNAVALAASPGAQGKGVMISMNDQISSAFGVTKTNTTNVATFQNPDTGFIGFMQDGKPYFFSAPVKKHTGQSEFSIAGLKTLPRVDVIYNTLGADGVLVNAAVQAGAQGIINAGMGDGNMPTAVMDALVAAHQKGIAVVVGSRIDSGLVMPRAVFKKADFATAMMHNPQKARILLMLALTKTHDSKEIQRIFDEY